METDESLYHAALNIIDKFSNQFTGTDSVVIFEVSNTNVQKFGNAIHRDCDIVYF